MAGTPFSTDSQLRSGMPKRSEFLGMDATHAAVVADHGWRHTLHLIRVLSLNEVRLRMRRLSTLFAVMAMIAISWAMIVDPQTGSSMMAINNARVLYTSSALAMGSASLLSFLLALIGFYLVRGRIVEDLRSGIGSVIASTSVSNSLFLFSRWLGGAAYMLALVLVAMFSIIVLHAIRGDGPIQLWVYLQTYLLVLGPMIVFAVGAAILFDSVPVLMGKAGDFLYFIAWVMQISIISKIEELSAGAMSPWLLLDFSGLVTTIFTLKAHLFTNHFSLGSSTFDPQVTPITLPVVMWSMQMALMRIGTAALALCLLLPAVPLFHRFSPDKVKQSHARKRRSPLEILNGWSRPLAKQVQALFVWSAQFPNFFGQVLADIALTLVNAPFAILVLVVVTVFAALMKLQSLSGLTLFAVAFWGVLISDVSTRDFQAAIEGMTAAVNGGAMRRYLRQLSATMVLGFLFVGVILFRLSFASPFMALVLAIGIVSMSALATALGKTSKTSKTFMSLYLFTLYVATQATKAPILDIFGFNGVATSAQVLMHLEIAAAAIFTGYFYTRWKSA
ncbi:hypothetical protein [Undibacterium flavidum]|uniref:ABC-2 type transport system permease protein n=1 Tax=Undibacterium flavidum TaxID=2762297 RepID=A0ABR6Y6A3_9BURK|nr:hypothetical protein [Undibacterium flavidum]MBC3872157.1 hypothetical protein [Undibacterium flavidum]